MQTRCYLFIIIIITCALRLYHVLSQKSVCLSGSSVDDWFGLGFRLGKCGQLNNPKQCLCLVRSLKVLYWIFANEVVTLSSLFRVMDPVGWPLSPCQSHWAPCFAYDTLNRLIKTHLIQLSKYLLCDSFKSSVLNSWRCFVQCVPLI
jgi:hypothetical protein